MENNNLIVEKEKILLEESILSAEKEQYFRTQIANLTETNNSLKEENLELKEQLEYLKRMVFGQRSEKSEIIMPNAVQINLFNEAETDPDAQIEQVGQTITFTVKRKTKRTHKETFENLEVKEIIHQVENKSCPECGSEMEVTGKEFVRDELVYVPAKMYLRKHYVEVLKCVSCGMDESKDIESSDIQKQVFIKGKAPSPVILGSYCSPELLAHILYEKYVQSVPLNRQEKDYIAAGANVLRASMCNWVNFSGKQYAKPVFDEMKKQLLFQNVIHADETVVQVLHEPDRKAKTQSRMWVYCTDKSAERFMALFEYTPTRNGENAVKFLDDYSGYLVCDGYDGYNKLKNIKRCGCWAHARRKFVEALPSDKELLPTSRAAKGVGYINKIYEIERNLGNLIREEKQKQRQEQIKPVLDEFFAWLDTVEPSGGTKLAKAVQYALNEKRYLCRFLESPDIAIDNNRAENSIRPFVVGRKSWLFSDSVKGAEASAMWYSLAVTACVNGLNVEEYFYRLLTSTKPVMPW